MTPIKRCKNPAFVKQGNGTISWDTGIYSNYFSDINYGPYFLTKHYDHLVRLILDANMVSYGTFTERDAGGNEMGLLSMQGNMR